MHWPLSLTEAFLLLIVVALLLIYERLAAIYDKLTERERKKKEADKRRMQEWSRKSALQSEAWAKLSAEDQARFNDFYYDHAVGKISDEQFEAMRNELREKTRGVLS